MTTKMNKIHNMDCLEFMKTVPDNYFDLLVVDPPYFEVKGDFDFIWKTFDEFLEWIETLAIEFKRILSDKGSLYLYGHAKKIAYKQVIFDKYFNLENNLKWYKTDCRTRIGFDVFNSYPPVSEHILFYSNEVGMTGLEAIEEEFIKPRNPFSLYLRNEFKKAKVTSKEISKLFPSKTGGLTGCVSNWLNGNNVITGEQYQKVREYLECKFLDKPYEELRQEYEELRRPFQNKNRLDDVMMFAQEVHITGKYAHPTQKPPKLSKALISTSTRKDSKVYIPFIGSGVEAEQCISLGLEWTGTELEADYVAIANKRLEQVQGSLF